MPTDLPGLADIQAYAAANGIPIEDTVEKARQLMAMDPDGMAEGARRLGTVASGLDTTGQDVGRAGTDLLGSAWTGQSREAFGPSHAALVEKVGAGRDHAQALAGQVGQHATLAGQSQQTVVSATAVAAANLRMLGMQG